MKLSHLLLPALLLSDTVSTPEQKQKPQKSGLSGVKKGKGLKWAIRIEDKPHAKN
jgi:hypothetical protein